MGPLVMLIQYQKDPFAAVPKMPRRVKRTAPAPQTMAQKKSRKNPEIVLLHILSGSTTFKKVLKIASVLHTFGVQAQLRRFAPPKGRGDRNQPQRPHTSHETKTPSKKDGISPRIR